MIGEKGADGWVDDEFMTRGDARISATIMGRNMFGRLDGGPATIQQYLRAGLIDDMHVAVAPVLLAGGERLFDNLGGGPDGYEVVEFAPSASVAHARLSRTR